MKRLIMVAAVLGCLAVGLPVASASAALSVTECEQTLHGYPSGNDNDLGYAASLIPGTNNWTWGRYYRLSDWYIIHDVNYYTSNWSYIRTSQFRCYDANHTGQLSSSEDWLAIL